MSEAHSRSDELAHEAAYENGRALGLAAIAELQRSAPIESNQKAWLLGFLQGALEAAGQSASQTTHVAYATPSSPIDSGDQGLGSTRWQARVSAIENHGSEQFGWQSVAFEADERRLHFAPGASLALWPNNDPEEVRRILRTLGASAQSLVPTENGSEPAWQALLERVDISTTNSDTLRLLAEYSRLSSESNSLLALAESKGDKPRPLLALLRRFPSSRPPLERLLSSLQLLEPSYIPIASSCLERSKPLLATVHTAAGTNAWGHVTTALQSRLRVGEWLSISLDTHRFAARLCADDLEPVIIIADGPYVALARAFAAERRERQAKGRTWVIAAGVETNHFPFARSLAAWHRAGSLSRFDVAPGLDTQETLSTLAELEENLWRWLVDHSRCYLASPRQNLRDEVSIWFVSLLARRYRLDHAQATQRLAQLAEAEQWVLLPTEPMRAPSEEISHRFQKHD